MHFHPASSSVGGSPPHAGLHRAARTLVLYRHPLRTPVLARAAAQHEKPRVCLRGAHSPPAQHGLKLDRDGSHSSFSHLLISFWGFRHKHQIAIAIGTAPRAAFAEKEMQSNTSHQCELRPTFQGPQKVSEELPVCISVAISLGL